MRTLLIASAVGSLLLHTPKAEACGGTYSFKLDPQVFRLSTHFIVGMGKHNHRRTFALTGTGTPAKNVVWRQLAPMSYDATQIAAGIAIANPVTFTLVGPSGTRVVSTKKHVFLSRSWDFDTATGAFEVPDVEGFSIAIEGNRPDAKWIALDDNAYAKKSALAWVTAQGLEPYDNGSIYVNRVAGSDLEIISLFPKNGTKMVTMLKRGDDRVGSYQGNPMGAFANDGEMQLVLADGARVRTVRV